MKKYLVFAMISVFCVFASSCSVQNNDSKSPASTTVLQTTEQKIETTSHTEKPTEVTTEKPTEESTEKPTDPPTEIETEQTIRTISDGDTIELTGTVIVEEDNNAGHFSTYHAILNLDNPFSCYIIGMNYDGTTVPSPKKQTKNVREKPNEKNDKYNIKLLNPTAFIPRFA